jgi:hypothetical protein
MVVSGLRTMIDRSLSSCIAGFHQSCRFSQSFGPRRQRTAPSCAAAGGRLFTTRASISISLCWWWVDTEDGSTLRPSRLHRICYRRWRSCRRGGRPQIETELRAMIRRMSVENPLWGTPDALQCIVATPDTGLRRQRMQLLRQILTRARLHRESRLKKLMIARRFVKRRDEI